MIRVQATVEAQDLDRLTAALDPRALESLLVMAFQDALQPVATLARTLAPRGKTGKLARSIRVRVRRRRGLEISIFGGVPYSHLVEYGHRLVAGGKAPRAGRVLKRVSGVLTGPRGGRYTGQTIGFVNAKPFARPAFEQLAPEVEAQVAATMEAGIDRAARGGAWRAA